MCTLSSGLNTHLLVLRSSHTIILEILFLPIQTISRVRLIQAIQDQKLYRSIWQETQSAKQWRCLCCISNIFVTIPQSDLSPQMLNIVQNFVFFKIKKWQHCAYLMLCNSKLMDVRAFPKENINSLYSQLYNHNLHHNLHDVLINIWFKRRRWFLDFLDQEEP